VSFTIAATAGCVLALIVRQAGILIRRNIWGARLFLALIYILVFAAGMATTVFLVEWPLILLPGIGLAWSVAIFRNLLEDVRCRCARSEDDETKVIGIKPAVAPWRVAGESLVFLVLLIVGLYMIENVRGARAWKKAKEKAAAAGIETDWSRLVEPPVAEEENFLNAINGGLLDFKEPRSSGAAVIVRPQMANETMPIIPRNWNYSAYGDDPLFDAEQFRSNLLESQYDIPEGEDPVDYWVRIYRDYWSNFFEAAKRPYASYIHSPSAEDAFLETPNYLSLSLGVCPCLRCSRRPGTATGRYGDSPELRACFGKTPKVEWKQ